MERFLDVTRRLGFDTRQMDRGNKMFFMAEFKKSNRKSERGVDFEAKVCLAAACSTLVVSSLDRPCPDCCVHSVIASAKNKQKVSYYQRFGG